MNTQSINRFLGACGATGPLRLSAERPRVFGPVSVSLEKPFALIGSGVNADLRLDDNQVSHRHLYLQVYDGRVFAVDLGSRTGTFWEIGRQAYGWVDRGQSLWIGRHQIRLEEDGPEKEPAAASPNEPLLSRDYIYPGLPPVSLEFVKGGINKGGERKSARCSLNRVLVLLGRTEGCKIRLMDSSVSKFHCSLIRTPRGVWVVDLLSRNGIWVNGTKVPWARLEQGDRLEVGEFVLRLRYDQPDNDSPDESRDAKTDEAGNEIIRSVASDDPDESPRPVQAQIASEAPLIIVDEKPEDAAQPHALVAAPGRGMIPVELSESIAVVIANQFSQMQQQMFDQFHQAMMVMFQTFSTLHRDQMELVRQELDRVHELTRQLHALQAELAKQPAAAKDPEVQKLLKETQVETASPSADPARAFSSDGWQDAFREAAQKVMAATTEPGRSSEEAPTADPLFTFSSEPSVRNVSEGIKEVAAEVSPSQEEVKSALNAGQVPQEGQSVPPAAADIHAMLCQKIAALQAERQSRWQKIIGFLAGKQTGEAMP
jgi:pSer/pThr/pTyr-binding forkhead associated (FHA) protein